MHIKWQSVKRKKAARGHQTSGSTKIESCRANTLDRYMAKRGGSHKHPEYPTWCKKIDKYW